jgi:hypothetical protein
MRRAAATLLVVLVLAGCSSSNHHAARPATVVKTFRAYTGAGDLAVTVGDVATGSCWTNSIAAPVADAYRCISGNRIYDPCFASPRPAGPLEVACLAAPWDQAEVLRLSGALPTSKPLDGGRPWAIVLGNGARCVAATGTVPQAGGVTLDYHCTDGRDAGLLPRSGALRSAEYGTADGGPLRRVSVTTIWLA